MGFCFKARYAVLVDENMLMSIRLSSLDAYVQNLYELQLKCILKCNKNMTRKCVEVFYFKNNLICVGGDRVKITYTHNCFQIYKCLDILELYWPFFLNLYLRNI